MIYFIQSTADNSIKIGYSKDVKARLAGLQTASASKLILLGSMEGDRDLEASLHRKFDIFSVSGEWFKGDKLLTDFVKENCDNSQPDALTFPIDLDKELDTIERRYIRAAFSISQKGVDVAKMLGIDTRSLRYRIGKLDIER